MKNLLVLIVLIAAAGSFGRDSVGVQAGAEAVQIVEVAAAPNLGRY